MSSLMEGEGPQQQQQWQSDVGQPWQTGPGSCSIDGQARYRSSCQPDHITQSWDWICIFNSFRRNWPPGNYKKGNAGMEPAGPAWESQKLLGRSSHCQGEVLLSRAVTRKQWAHKSNKAFKDLFPTLWSRGIKKQNQLTIKAGPIKTKSMGSWLCMDHNPMGVRPGGFGQHIRQKKKPKYFNPRPHLFVEAHGCEVWRVWTTEQAKKII